MPTRSSRQTASTDHSPRRTATARQVPLRVATRDEVGWANKHQKRPVGSDPERLARSRACRLPGGQRGGPAQQSTQAEPSREPPPSSPRIDMCAVRRLTRPTACSRCAGPAAPRDGAGRASKIFWFESQSAVAQPGSARDRRHSSSPFRSGPWPFFPTRSRSSEPPSPRLCATREQAAAGGAGRAAKR